MEKSVQIIISDEVQGGESGTPMLINPTLSVMVPFVPTSYSISLTILTRGIDFTKAKKVSLDIISCNPKHIKNRLVIHNDISQIIKGTLPDMIMTNFNLNLRNVIFKDLGNYQVKFYVDEEVFSHEFVIIKRSEDE